jgi:hypothetical protein
MQDVPKPHALSSPSQAQSEIQQQVQMTSAQDKALPGTEMPVQIPGQESTQLRY